MKRAHSQTWGDAMVWHGGECTQGDEVMRCDEDWRDSGKRRRLHKFWLVKEWLVGWLPELLLLVRALMFGPFHLQIHPSICEEYPVYTTSLSSLTHWRVMGWSLRFSIGGGQRFQLDRDDGVGLLSFSYVTGYSTNSRFLTVAQLSWTVYDYLVYLARMEGLALPFGGRCSVT
jgi:hypothetical protein